METETSDVDLERMELNVTTPTPSMDRSPVYFLLVLCPIVFLFGIFGNTLVITIVIKYGYWKQRFLIYHCSFGMKKRRSIVIVIIADVLA